MTNPPLFPLCLSGSKICLRPSTTLGLSRPALAGARFLTVWRAIIRISEGAPEYIPENEILPIIVSKSSVVDCVVCSTIDKWNPACSSVMNVDGPQPHDSKCTKVTNVVHRENENEDVIRAPLQPTIQRMKCVRGKGGCFFVFMMKFVDGCIQQTMVQSPMNPVNTGVGKK